MYNEDQATSLQLISTKRHAVRRGDVYLYDNQANTKSQQPLRKPDEGVTCHSETAQPTRRGFIGSTCRKGGKADSDIADEFLRNVTDIQRQQQEQMHQMFDMQQPGTCSYCSY